MTAPMKPAERLGAALSHQEGDRVPFFLAVTLHPARALGLSIQDYFGSAEAVVEGQVRMYERLGHDAVTSWLHVAAEVGAFGGETVWRTDGPPNAGAPPLTTAAAVERLQVPDPRLDPVLARSLAVARGLKGRLGDDVPIMGGMVGPLSLPVVQLGFERYLDWLMDAPDLIRRLWQINEAFCIAWGNAQLAAGASAIGISEPLVSPSLLSSKLIRAEGLPVLRRVREGLQGGAALSTASAPMGELLQDLSQLGFVGLAPSCDESLAEAKAALRGRVTLMGGLNGLAMSHWSPQDAEAAVKQALRAAGAGGGFVLAEHHGEIPWCVSEDTLMAVGEAVHRWGGYPLDWTDP